MYTVVNVSGYSGLGIDQKVLFRLAQSMLVWLLFTLAFQKYKKKAWDILVRENKDKKKKLVAYYFC